MPVIWIKMFVVKEGRVEQFHPPADDDDRLLRWVLVDRELRCGPPANRVRPVGETGEIPRS